jgi:hypothetical protein
MAYTGHGHHIPGSNRGEGVTKANDVAKCGGPDMCPRCKRDVQDYKTAIMGSSTNYPEIAMRRVRVYLEARRTVLGIMEDYDLYVVLFAYILGGWKATVGTTLEDGHYFEVTYNKAKGETYLDRYLKLDNIVIPD